MWPVSRFFGEDGEGDIKCPVCGNGFLVSADDEDPKATLCLIHTPEPVDKEWIERSEFTCPFLLKPLALTRREQFALPKGCIRVFKTGQGELGSVYRAEFLRKCNEKYVPTVFTEEFSTFFTDKDEEDVLRNIIDKLVKTSSMSNPVCLVADGFPASKIIVASIRSRVRSSSLMRYPLF